MKIQKIIILAVVLVIAFCMPVKAQTPYEKMLDALPEIEKFEGQDLLEEYGITLKDQDFAENLTIENIFDIFKELIVNGYKGPLTAFLAVLSSALITGAFSSFLKDNEHFLSFLVISTSATVLLPLFSSLTVAASTLSAVANFMLSFIPIFISIVISSGFVSVAKVSTPLLLFVSSAVSKVSTNTFLPLMGGYLSLTIAGSVSREFSLTSFATSIKNAANFIMGLCTTVFLGVLSISGTVTAAGDSLALKTTRFLVSGVPVVGTAIAESINATTASAELLKTGVGAFGVIAVITILLPILVTLLLWKLSLFLSEFVAELLEIKVLASFLKAVSAVVSVTVGILIFVGILFIIGLAILIRVKR